MPYRQPVDGYRTGIEPVLLAASVPAQPGQRVLEAGTGAGAGLLCLLARCAGLRCVGVEIDADLADVARSNAAEAGGDLTILTADIAGHAPSPVFDHAIANPPWHDPAATASPIARRDLAKRSAAGLLESWTGALAACLRPGGTLTLALPAAATAEALGCLSQAGLGAPLVFPLWPASGREAKLVMLRAHQGRRGACRILAGLTLHDDHGYTAQARAVLWEAAALPFS